MKKYLPFILVVLHVVGLFGLTSSERDWFLSLTPLNLLITFLVALLLLERGKWSSLVTMMIVGFAGGFGAEYLGVHTGLIFGDYAYGAGLGPKWEDIPLAIGMNWAMLLLVTRSMANRMVSNGWMQAVIASVLMVLLDVFIEPVAPTLDYWEFDGRVAPFSNYVGWFLVALALHSIGTLFKASKWDTKGDVLIYTIQSAFFLVLFAAQ